MSKRTTKHSIQEKMEIVKIVLEGRDSLNHLSKVHGVKDQTISKWVRKYQSDGIEGLQEARTRKVYPEEVRIAAVQEYLAGEGSLLALSEKYRLSSHSVLERWIKRYTGGEQPKSSSKGMIPMTKGRKTTHSERIEIAQYTLAHELDYQAAMEKYQVSYQQVYSWVRKYQAHGEAGLVDRRGKNLTEETALTEEDRLRLRIKELEHRNEYLEAKEALIKKLDELERRGTFTDWED